MLNSRSYVSFSVITSQNAPLNTRKNKKIRNSLLIILDKKFLKMLNV
ncbi:conserved domain protein [Prevotella denticola CRIS 18C-A]|uniref:Conserved domain protein n=1 Tax=Prevotella denticola CRIS 18C-A TaxID=944557 RepID=F0H819_9BACT|nr:conserved domain protein [Prevotella denticola CRIS 18C-A]